MTITMIGQMMPLQNRAEFFRRITGKMTFQDRQFYKCAMRCFFSHSPWLAQKQFPRGMGSKTIRFVRPE